MGEKKTLGEKLQEVGTPVGGIRDVTTLPEGIPLYLEGGTVLRLRQAVLELSEDGEELGSVCSGSGLGGDFVTLSWGENTATFYLRDVLRAYVAEELGDPEAAARIPATKYEVDWPPVEPPEDHDEPCDCGHGYGRHVAEEVDGLNTPVAGACEARGCDCAQYAANEAEALS